MYRPMDYVIGWAAVIVIFLVVTGYIAAVARLATIAQIGATVKKFTVKSPISGAEITASRADDEEIMQNNLKQCREKPETYRLGVSREHYQWLAEQIITLRSLLDAERQNHDNTRRQILTPQSSIADVIRLADAFRSQIHS